MKVLFLTNNVISHDLYKWLKELEKVVILYEDKLNLDFIEKIKPDFIISYNYRYIIKHDIIDYMGSKIINLHISLLPWNRGVSPNLWSFIDDTPKGVTIHLIDQGLDTGDILVNKEIYFIDEEETLASSYSKLHQEIQILFRNNWDNIKNQILQPVKQTGAGSSHNLNDYAVICERLQLKSWDIPITELKQKLI